MKSLLRICYLFGVCVLLATCNADEPVEPALDLAYFPLKVGNYLLYDVQESTILNGVETKSSYELRSVITDSTKNENGTVTYIIVREKRASSAIAWQPFEAWSAQLVNNKLIQNESNVLFVKLVFPPSLNVRWNGNEFNNLPDNGNLFNDSNSDKYEVSQVDANTTLPNGFQAINTLTVTQNNYDDSFTGKDQRLEVYSKDIGLAYKETIQVTYCTSNTSCYGQQFVEKGVILIQSLKSYGAL